MTNALLPGPDLDEEDKKIVALGEEYAKSGRAVYEWFLEAVAEKTFNERFDLFKQRPDVGGNYGFIDEITFKGEKIPLNGTNQNMLFHRPLGDKRNNDAYAEIIREQVKGFVFNNFMAVASQVQPKYVPRKPEERPPRWMSPFAWGRPVGKIIDGWRYKQYFFKLSENQEVRKFTEHYRDKPVDLRYISAGLEWILYRVNIPSFRMRQPSFTDGAQVMVPFNTNVWVIMTPDFLVHEDNPKDPPTLIPASGKIIGRYGFGYSFIQVPEKDTFLAYGPGHLGPGFMNFHFDIYDSGDVWIYNGFAANQPKRFVNLPANPVEWMAQAMGWATVGMSQPFFAGPLALSRMLPFANARLDPMFSFVDMANFMTGGRAARQMNISRNQVLRDVMAIHFQDTYAFAVNMQRIFNEGNLRNAPETPAFDPMTTNSWGVGTLPTIGPEIIDPWPPIPPDEEM